MPLTTRFYRALVIGFLASTLWACGQAGPLYLPQDAEKETNQEEAEQQQPQNQSEQLMLEAELSQLEQEK